MARKVTEEELAGGTFIDSKTGEKIHVAFVQYPEPFATVQHKTEDTIQEYRDINELEDPADPQSGKLKTRLIPGTITHVETVTVAELLTRVQRIPE